MRNFILLTLLLIFIGCDQKQTSRPTVVPQQPQSAPAPTAPPTPTIPTVAPSSPAPPTGSGAPVVNPTIPTGPTTSPNAGLTPKKDQKPAGPSITDDNLRPGDIPQRQFVFISRTGRAYHRDGCKSLRGIRFSIPLESATTRYQPCPNCKPPTK